MEFILSYLTAHWLSVGAVAYLLAMTLYGHYRGFLRIALTMSALLISLFFVRFAGPQVNTFLKENTQIRTLIQKSFVKAVTKDAAAQNGASADEQSAAGEESGSLPAQQRQVIEQLGVPRQVREILLENNNSRIYELLGVDTFLDYVGAGLADMFLNLIISVLLFLLVYVGLRVLMNLLDLVARLPILYGMNQIAGAAAGLLRGLFWLWGLFLLADLFSGAVWAKAVSAQIQDSLFLGILYRINPFDRIFTGVLKNFL